MANLTGVFNLLEKIDCSIWTLPNGETKYRHENYERGTIIEHWQARTQIWGEPHTIGNFGGSDNYLFYHIEIAPQIIHVTGAY